MEDLYTEDDIIELDDYLKGLVGKILLDENGEFFTLKSFDIQGKDVEEFKLFSKNSTNRMFYINQLIIEGDDKTYIHKNDEMCSIAGIKSLKDYELNYSRLQLNLIKFTLRNDITLKFGKPELV